ncbi:MAG: type I restriction enzyme HsdR N-terminal domain-containing protein [Bacteroidota bacterium]
MREKRTLNFPEFDHKIKQVDNEEYIFDPVRKKYVKLTPEEWVRQHAIHYLVGYKKVPLSLVSVEKQFKYNKMQQRADLVVFKSTGKPMLIVECKAPSVKITQETFEQIARYNVAIRVDYLMVTNGIDHFYCKMDYKKWSYAFLKELPDYDQWQVE